MKLITVIFFALMGFATFNSIVAVEEIMQEIYLIKAIGYFLIVNTFEQWEFK